MTLKVRSVKSLKLPLLISNKQKKASNYAGSIFIILTNKALNYRTSTALRSEKAFSKRVTIDA